MLLGLLYWLLSAGGMVGDIALGGAQFISLSVSNLTDWLDKQ